MFFFFNLAVFAHLTLPIALKGLQSQSFHKLDSLTIKMFYTANGINRPCSFQKEYFFLKKYTVIQKEVFPSKRNTLLVVKKGNK